jgi:TonB family protein
LPVLLGAAVVIALAFGGVRLLRSHGSPSPAPIAEGTLPQAAGSGEPATQDPHIAGASAVNSNRGDLVAATAALHEVMPDVPPGVRRSIRGHIKVSVRIIVDPDGSVVAANAERGAHSRYFSRLASEAARQWTFAAVDGQSRRTMQIRFDFDRDETTGSVAPK